MVNFLENVDIGSPLKAPKAPFLPNFKNRMLIQLLKIELGVFTGLETEFCLLPIIELFIKLERPYFCY